MNKLDFKVALRTLYRNKLFASINVFGLSIGMGVTIIAFLIVAHDFSFDRHHKDDERIYRIVSQVGVEPNILYMSGCNLYNVTVEDNKLVFKNLG